jgi:carboxyl-terminal processing protease
MNESENKQYGLDNAYAEESLNTISDKNNSKKEKNSAEKSKGKSKKKSKGQGSGSDGKGNGKSKDKKAGTSLTKLLFFLLGVLTSCVVLALCIYVFKLGRIIDEKTYQEYKAIEKEYGKYYEIEKLFEEEAIGEYTKADLDELISEAILSGLDDEYAEYYTKSEFDNIMRQFLDAYSGIGIATVKDDGRYVVSRVLSNSPAEEAGMSVGDIILKIDGKDVDADDNISKLVSGETGSKIEITVKRDGENLDFTMYRAEVEEDSVSSKVQDESAGIGYIKIKTFREGTAKEFKLAVKDLKNNGCERFIIDLRGNTGGVESEGIDVADELLPSCRIISQKDKNGKEKIYNSDQSQLISKYVILVDGYTASASEIVSSAVQGNGGILIGSKTYGKGLVQAVKSFSDGTAIKYTMAEYFGPDGSKINKVGLTPNIQSSDPIADAVKELTK